MALRALSAVFKEEDAPAGRRGLGAPCDFGDAVWRADTLAQHTSPAGVVATGHALLDAELPGGGWPVGGLCEILQSHSAQSEWRLLLPALCAVQQGLGQPVKLGVTAGQNQAQARAVPHGALALNAVDWVALIGPPQVPFGPALAAQGLDVRRLLWVKAQAPAERLWAAEQALRCEGVAAVLAWLPQVQAAHLRRLQVAAMTHAKLLFVMRPAAAQNESSPALLRLLLPTPAPTPTPLQEASSAPRSVFRQRAISPSPLQEASACADPGDLHIQLLKRRGPSRAGILALPARAADQWERQHALDSFAA